MMNKHNSGWLVYYNVPTASGSFRESCVFCANKAEVEDKKRLCKQVGYTITNITPVETKKKGDSKNEIV